MVKEFKITFMGKELIFIELEDGRYQSTHNATFKEKYDTLKRAIIMEALTHYQEENIFISYDKPYTMISVTLQSDGTYTATVVNDSEKDDDGVSPLYTSTHKECYSALNNAITNMLAVELHKMDFEEPKRTPPCETYGELIKRLSQQDPNAPIACSFWNVSDVDGIVYEYNEENGTLHTLTDYETSLVLYNISNNQDSEVGITGESIRCAVANVIRERK